MSRARRQSGVSLLWFIFVIVVLLVVAIVGFRVLPAYIEYFSVEKALAESLRDVQMANNTGAIRNLFQRKADAGYIDSVNSREIVVEKDGNEYVASIEWTRKLHLVSNAYLLLEFRAEARR